MIILKLTVGALVFCALLFALSLVAFGLMLQERWPKTWKSRSARTWADAARAGCCARRP